MKEKEYDWSSFKPLNKKTSTEQTADMTQTDNGEYDWSSFKPLNKDSFSHKANEAFRYLYQFPAGVASAVTYPANLLQMAGTGESLGEYGELEERIPELQKQFPQAPWQNFKGLNKERYMGAVQEASESFPTQQNIERGVENLTGLGLTPQTTGQENIRLGGAAFGFNPGNILQKSISAAAVPSAKFGMEEVGVPSPLAEILSFGADAGRSAIGSAWKSFKEPPPGPPKFLSEVGTPKAMADLEMSQKNLSTRISKISDENINKFESNLNKISPEKNISEVKDFNTRALEENIVRQNQEPILNSVSPRKDDLNESWKSVQKAVEDNFDKAKSNYTSLYNFVDENAKGMSHAPAHTFEAAKKLSKEMNASLYAAPEEMGLKNASDVMIAKLIKPQDELAATLIQDLQREGIYADYEEVLNMLQKEAMNDAPRKIKVSKLLATKRSINRILAKSDIIPAPVDLLRGISKALKKDIEAGLEQNPSVANAFQQAEESFANTQDIFNNKNMVSFRKNETPDKLSSTFSSSSNLERLNSALEGSSAETDLAHRLVVEHIAGQGTENASASSKELSNYLSPKANNALNKLISAGDTLSTEGQQALARSRIFKEIQESAATGTKPEGVLKLMQTKEGYNLVNTSLRGSQKGQQVLDILRRKFIEDLITPVIDDSGQIDFSKTSKILKNDFSKQVIKDALGKDGVEFFTQLETYGKNFSKNINTLENRTPGVISKIAEKTLTKEAALLLGGMSFVVPHAASVGIGLFGAKAAMEGGRNLWLQMVLKDPKVMNTVRYLGNKNLTPEQLSSGFKKLSVLISNNQNKKGEK